MLEYSNYPMLELSNAPNCSNTPILQTLQRSNAPKLEQQNTTIQHDIPTKHKEPNNKQHTKVAQLYQICWASEAQLFSQLRKLAKSVKPIMQCIIWPKISTELACTTLSIAQLGERKNSTSVLTLLTAFCILTTYIANSTCTSCTTCWCVPTSLDVLDEIELDWSFTVWRGS